MKDLISLMIAQLEEKVSAVDSLKVPCDKELSETSARRRKNWQFPNRHTDCQVCAAHKRGCQIADNTRRAGTASQAAVTKLLAEEKDALAKNQKDLEDGIESALRWVFCATTTGDETERMKLQARKAQEPLDCSR